MMNARYTRHIQLAEVGEAGQQKLLDARVLVVGAGGLGCPVLQYLAASGVGHLGIVDGDVVSLSNLHRQILYTEKEIGQPKARCAKAKLQELNPSIEVTAYQEVLSAANYKSIVASYDIIVDGTDNFTTRYLLSDACLLANKPLVFGALYKFEGQVSVFHYQEGPSYRCLFPKPPQAGEVPSCNEIGVLGVLPGIIGMLQATEVLKIILGIGEVLSGKVLYYNALQQQQRILRFSKNKAEITRVLQNQNPIPIALNDCLSVPLISLAELNKTENLLWIDVRERDEIPIFHEKHLLQNPLSTLDFSKDAYQTEAKKIFFCTSGIRSKQAVLKAQEEGITACYSLREGASELNQWLTQKV